MKEVSCKALDVFFKDLKRRGLPPERLTEGVPYSLQHLRNKHERIEWDVFVKMMENGDEVWTPDEYRDLGGAFLRNPLFRPFALIGSLLFTARDFYGWITNPKSGMGNQFFTCIEPSLRDTGPNQVEITLALPEGFASCPAFFTVTEGSFVDLPRLVGRGPAEVKLSIGERGAVYAVSIPPGGGVLGRFKRAIVRPFLGRQAARELRDAHEQLTERYAELEDYRDNLEQKVEERTAQLREAQEARNRIFANINHEIRTPLSLISLATDQLQARLAVEEDPFVDEQLRGVGYNLRRLLQLVDGLLLLAAGQEGKLRIDPVAVEVGGLIRDVVNAWAPAATEAEIQIAYEGPERCVALVDRPAMERVVANLISNAIKFTRTGQITAALTAGDEDLEIRVTDTGIGIAPDQIDRVFGRFEQAGAAVRSGAHGSGIGLSIVRELVGAHGGEISLTSELGKGSVFTVVLPRAVTSVEAITSGDGIDVGPLLRDGRHAASGSQVLQPEGTALATLLVAEDEPELLAAVGNILKDDYRVILAPDGETALELAEVHRPDMLVSDIGMPGMDGLELTRQFRLLPGNRLAPVLLLTAFSSVADRLAGFEAGAIDYVLKPFEPRELRARIRSLLSLRTLALKLHETEQLASLGMLSSGLAHEFRNPANGVLNAVAPLRRLVSAEPSASGGDESAKRELLDVIEGCARQIAALSRELLGYSSASPSDGQIVGLGKIVDRALLLVGPGLEHVDLRRRAGDELIRCAAPFFSQALGNLLSNAVAAAGPGGWVEVSSVVEGELVSIDVSDSGEGVPAELRERIFEPFFTTKGPSDGTGLGLFTARQIVERHGGSLNVVEGRDGAVFRIELPLGTENEVDSPNDERDLHP